MSDADDIKVEYRDALAAFHKAVRRLWCARCRLIALRATS